MDLGKLVLDFYSTLILIFGFYVLWNIIWYSWHIGGLHAKNVLYTPVFITLKDAISPFVTVIIRRRFPPLFYYLSDGRVLLVNKRTTVEMRLAESVRNLFIIGRVIQALSGEWYVPVRRWLEVIAKFLLVAIPVSIYMGKQMFAWNVILFTVIVLLITYFDEDGYDRALIMFAQMLDISEDMQYMLERMRMYPFSLFMILRVPIDIISVLGGRKSNG